MIANWKNRALVGCVIVLPAGLVVTLTGQPADGAREAAAGPPRYTGE